MPLARRQGHRSIAQSRRRHRRRLSRSAWGRDGRKTYRRREGETSCPRSPGIGKDLPLVVSLDLHANVTPEMVEACRLADCLAHLSATSTWPTPVARANISHCSGTRRRLAKAVRQLPFLIPISWQCTNYQPTKGSYQSFARWIAAAGRAIVRARLSGAYFSPDCGATVIRLWHDPSPTRRRREQHRRVDREH